MAATYAQVRGGYCSPSPPSKPIAPPSLACLRPRGTAPKTVMQTTASIGGFGAAAAVAGGSAAAAVRLDPVPLLVQLVQCILLPTLLGAGVRGASEGACGVVWWGGVGMEGWRAACCFVCAHMRVWWFSPRRCPRCTAGACAHVPTRAPQCHTRADPAHRPCSLLFVTCRLRLSPHMSSHLAPHLHT